MACVSLCEVRDVYRELGLWFGGCFCSFFGGAGGGVYVVWGLRATSTTVVKVRCNFGLALRVCIYYCCSIPINLVLRFYWFLFFGYSRL